MIIVLIVLIQLSSLHFPHIKRQSHAVETSLLDTSAIVTPLFMFIRWLSPGVTTSATLALLQQLTLDTRGTVFSSSQHHGTVRQDTCSWAYQFAEAPQKQHCQQHHQQRTNHHHIYTGLFRILIRHIHFGLGCWTCYGWQNIFSPLRISEPPYPELTDKLAIWSEQLYIQVTSNEVHPQTSLNAKNHGRVTGYRGNSLDEQYGPSN